MNIRETVPADPALEKLQAFAAEMFPAACPPWLPRAEIERFIAESLSPEQFAAWLADPDTHVRVAERDERVVGYAVSIHGAHEDSPQLLAGVRSAYLSKLYVDPALRGAGLAATLLSDAVQAARADGCSGLWLGVNAENARAHAFYAKSGLRPAGQRRFRVGSQVFVDDYLAIRW